MQDFLWSIFEKFGEDKTKQFIETSLINAPKLYWIFFNWYYNKDIKLEQSTLKALSSSKKSNKQSLTIEDLAPKPKPVSPMKYSPMKT